MLDVVALFVGQFAITKVSVRAALAGFGLVRAAPDKGKQRDVGDRQ